MFRGRAENNCKQQPLSLIVGTDNPELQTKKEHTTTDKHGFQDVTRNNDGGR